MKILFSLNHYLPHRLAGVEMYTHQLAGSLKAAGHEVVVLVPNFDKEDNSSYYYEGIQVIQYAEHSPDSRRFIMGKTAPPGLVFYKEILVKEQPDFVHFQEISGGRGIGKFHVEAAKSLGLRILLTMHLSTYSCETGNLVYKEKELCDGLIRPQRCSACAWHARGLIGVKANLLGTAAKILHSTHVDVSSHNSSFGTAFGFPFLIEKKKKSLLQFSALLDKIVVLTHFYKKILLNNGVTEEKLQYIPQGLTGIPVERIAGQTNLPIRLVFVGRVSKYKGLHLLLEAINQLSPHQVTLDIFGPITESAYADECMATIEKMENVCFKGSIAPGEVIPMLARHDLLCLPSTFSEMSPLVIQEAFAAGIPVLSSNVYGNAEQVLHDKNGWLFEFKSSDSLLQQLKKLVQSPGLIDEAKKNIPSTRSFEVLAQEHLELYKHIARG